MSIADNRRWIASHLNPYVMRALSDEPEGIAILERELPTLRFNDRIIMADRGEIFIQAVRNRPGTLYEAMEQFPSRNVSYALFAHSDAPPPGCTESLEIQRFEFTPLRHDEVRQSTTAAPASVKRRVDRVARRIHAPSSGETRNRIIDLLFRNNPSFVTLSPPERLLSTVTLFDDGNRNGGFSLRVDPLANGTESRLSIAVGNPPGNDLLRQILEILRRLQIAVNRAYCITISNGTHPYFLGTFYLRCHDSGCSFAPESPEVETLRRELVSTLLLSTASPFYRDLVVGLGMPEWDVSLIAAISLFVSSLLSCSDPDRYSDREVAAAFRCHPGLSTRLIELFRCRFDPSLTRREESLPQMLRSCSGEIDQYATGSRHRDETRRTIYRTALAFVTKTLRTNAFVMERQALSFRLDPSILEDLGGEESLRLPPARPFRIFYFIARDGYGFQIAFADIARGGWRTLIPRTYDERETMSQELFREVFVLAHTQHLKNKDIYEGGAKTVTLLIPPDRRREGDRTMSLYRLQYAVANALLDIVVTRDGHPVHPSVVDYYRRDEAIELGPDENMHDVMIEAIASLSRRRGYLLGSGIISGKRAGINHRRYGVTSTGVVTFASRTLREIGIDFFRDPFTLSMTGGPGGDVAGNCIRIILERAPLARFLAILDGTAALFDPGGIDRGELARLALNSDLECFDPRMLGEGGFLVCRRVMRVEGFRELHRQIRRERGELVEEWLSTDELHRRLERVIPDTAVDLFIPAGGRPETIDDETWRSFLDETGTPRVRAIVEGANSFLSPRAREELQRRGVLLMRDASANKCGVITSSYEIIANLLMNDEEFVQRKERYVRDVLEILERRASDEADLIFRRRRDQPEKLMTALSEEISREINGHQERLLALFSSRDTLLARPPLRAALLAHFPAIVREDPLLRRRVFRLPRTYRCAVLAAELAGSLVYHHDDRCGYEESVMRHAARYLPRRAGSPSAPPPRGNG